MSEPTNADWTVLTDELVEVVESVSRRLASTAFPADDLEQEALILLATNAKEVRELMEEIPEAGPRRVATWLGHRLRDLIRPETRREIRSEPLDRVLEHHRLLDEGA